MANWSSWLKEGMAGGRSAEVAWAGDGLNARTTRRIRRLVRKGQVAPDRASARLAVALARERQRSTSPAALSVFALIPAAAAWLAIERLQSHGVDGPAAFFAVAALWGVWAIARALVLGRSARKAELANMRRLVELGESYPSRPPTGLLPVSVPARLAGAVLSWVIYDLSYGALTPALDGRALSLDRVVGRGALWAVFMVVLNLTLLPGQRERQSEKQTVGQRQRVG